MNRFWAAAYGYEVLMAVVCLPLFVAALVTGLGWRSLAILGAGIFWAVMARFSRRRADAARRHRELRRRRRERQAAGTWNGPSRD